MVLFVVRLVFRILFLGFITRLRIFRHRLGFLTWFVFFTNAWGIRAVRIFSFISGIIILFFIQLAGIDFAGILVAIWSRFTGFFFRAWLLL